MDDLPYRIWIGDYIAARARSENEARIVCQALAEYHGKGARVDFRGKLLLEVGLVEEGSE